jgi:hypothetical protein
MYKIPDPQKYAKFYSCYKSNPTTSKFRTNWICFEGSTVAEAEKAHLEEVRRNKKEGIVQSSSVLLTSGLPFSFMRQASVYWQLFYRPNILFKNCYDSINSEE